VTPGTGAFRRAVVALFAGGFVTFAILHCTQPLMPIFSERFGVSPAAASLSLSATTATLAVSLLFAAALPGSRKAVMIVSLLGSSSLALLLALSPSFVTLLAVRALQGVVLAGLPSVAMAYVSEEFRPEGLGTAMGLYVSGTSVGGMVGRISAGILADVFSWRVALGAVGAVGLLGALWFWSALPPPSNSSPRASGQEGARTEFFKSLLRPLKDPGLVCVFVVGFLLMGSFMTLFNYVGYLLLGPPYRLSQAAVGMVFAAYLAGTFSSAWMGRLADRLGRPQVLRCGVAIMLLGASLTLLGNLYAILAGIVAFVFGFFGAHAVASGLVGERASDESKAQASSLYLLFYYAGSSVVGTAGGLLWSPYGWSGIVISIIVLLLVALVATMTLPSLPTPRHPSR
jgi:YNFM family putative membrane transporter